MNINEEINKKVEFALEGLGIDAVEKLQETAPRATGHLKDHIDFNVEGYELTISMPEYAKYLEYGTPPHFPPVDAIKEWCIAKGINPKAAYAIAVVISRNGTRPQPWIRPYFNNHLKKDLIRNLTKAFS